MVENIIRLRLKRHMKIVIFIILFAVGKDVWKEKYLKQNLLRG